MVVALFFCYLVAHFALYASVLRHRRITASEKGIFLYHFIPAAAWVVVLGLLTVFLEGFSFAHVILIGSLHGIYSLTLLELWALADGGYSLAILDCLDFRKDLGERRILGELELLGTAKKQARVADLLRIGLVQETPDGYRLTAPGHIAALAIAAIVRVSDTVMTH
jgi:hypothetical protein